MDAIVDLSQAAELYRKKGWGPIPLENDANGFPKKPFTPNWQVHSPYGTPYPPEIWERATGLGLVLGRISNGLCAVDIDDVAMGRAAIDACPWTRTVETIRHRAHLYFIERIPSVSRRLTVSYQGRDVCIELKTTGTQVAAPPTPGYTRRSSREIEPASMPTIADAWAKIAALLEIEQPRPDSNPLRVPAWSPFVPKDYRNNTLYLEAHRLREAGLSLDLALDHLRHRWETRYQQGEITWQECEQTVRSAYRKLTPEQIDGRDGYRLWVGWNTPNASRPGQHDTTNRPEHPA